MSHCWKDMRYETSVFLSSADMCCQWLKPANHCIVSITPLLWTLHSSVLHQGYNTVTAALLLCAMGKKIWEKLPSRKYEAAASTSVLNEQVQGHEMLTAQNDKTLKSAKSSPFIDCQMSYFTFPIDTTHTIEIDLPWHLDEEVHKGVDECQLVCVSFKHLQLLDLRGKQRGGRSSASTVHINCLSLPLLLFSQKALCLIIC